MHKKKLFKEENSFACHSCSTVPKGYSPGSYLGQVGADEPAPVPTLCVELVESQSEHQFVKNRSSTYRIKVCIKKKKKATEKKNKTVALIPATLLTVQHLFSS